MFMLLSEGRGLAYLAAPPSLQAVVIAKVIKLACLAGFCGLIQRECDRFPG